MRVKLWLDVADRLAEESTCLRLRVGCVLVDVNGHVVSTGYNGSPAGRPHCRPSTCLRDESGCSALHAEQNAVARLRTGIANTAFISHSPCVTCVQLLTAVGVNAVWFRNLHREHEEAKRMADNYGLRYIHENVKS